MLAGYNYKNLASITLQNAGLTTDTTITIPTSDASILPQTPFYATIMPVTQLANNSNSEIIIATGSTTSGTNTILSVTRAQRNTSAISWNAGEAVLTQPVYVEDIPNYTAGDNITIENEVISFDGGAETVSNTTPSSSFTLDALSGSPIRLSIYGDTYQKSYRGKNLLSVYNVGEITRNGITMTANSDGSLTFNGTCTGSAFSVKCSDTMDTVLPQGSYTYSRNAEISGISGLDIIIYKNTGVRIGSSNNDNSYTFTSTGSDIQTYYIWAYISVGTTFDNYTIRPQIEAGSTATSYEPYVGGMPSPNPDYPQAINVVTGTQTVTITDGASQSQAFTISLGSIELCKIGNYQDYIYKSGDDWYVHKEVGKKVFDGTENFQYGLRADSYSLSVSSYLSNFILPAGTVNYYITTFKPVWGAPERIGQTGIGSYMNFNYNGSSTSSGLSNFKTWLALGTTIMYAPLATATDTQITDATLISQLEAISLYTGTNAITVSSANLPGLLLITSYANTVNGKFGNVVWKGNTTSGVTQLKDQNGTNVFPNLKDGQVTSTKIDFTTLLSQKTTFAASDINASSANVTVLTSGTEITIRTNPEKTLFEVYGRFTTTATAVAETSVYIQTDLRPSQTMIITPAGFMTGVDSNGKMNGNFASQTIAIGTDGKMTFRSVNWADSSSQNRMTSFTFPTLTTIG